MLGVVSLYATRTTHSWTGSIIYPPSLQDIFKQILAIVCCVQKKENKTMFSFVFVVHTRC